MAFQLESLPEDAVRWLKHACPDDHYPAAVDLRLAGRVKMGGWCRFTARHRIDRSGYRFNVSTRRRLLRVRTHDTYRAGEAHLRRHLAGVIPLGHESDTRQVRSGAWRFATDRILWLPGPDVAAGWFGAGAGRLDVRVRIDDELVSTAMIVGPSGALRTLIGQRYSSVAPSGAYAEFAFQLTILGEQTFDGITVPSRLVASRRGPDGGTGLEPESTFYEARVVAARFAFD